MMQFFQIKHVYIFAPFVHILPNISTHVNLLFSILCSTILASINQVDHSSQKLIRETQSALCISLVFIIETKCVSISVCRAY